MRTVVPFAVSEPKTRLSSTLDVDERRAFARAMLSDVLDSIREAGGDPEVLATGELGVDAPVTVDDRSLDDAVNEVLADAAGDPVAVVVADLALATSDAVARLYEPDADVVLAPGRGGGTNAIVARHPEFRVDYHDASIRDHRRIAEEVAEDVVEVDSYRLATDIDERDDLAEILLHGGGESRDWLVDAGFELDVSDGRVGVVRNSGT